MYSKVGLTGHSLRVVMLTTILTLAQLLKLLHFAIQAKRTIFNFRYSGSLALRESILGRFYGKDMF